MNPHDAIVRGLEQRRTIETPTGQSRSAMLADIVIESLVAAGYKIVPSNDRLERSDAE